VPDRCAQRPRGISYPCLASKRVGEYRANDPTGNSSITAEPQPLD
jgi:hypothetical protein